MQFDVARRHLHMTARRCAACAGALLRNGAVENDVRSQRGRRLQLKIEEDTDSAVGKTNFVLIQNRGGIWAVLNNDTDEICYGYGMVSRFMICMLCDYS